MRELFWGEIEEDNARGCNVAHAPDGAIGFNGAAELAEAGEHGVDDALGAAFGAGPADGVTGESEDETEGTAGRGVEWEKGVRGASGEEGAGFFGCEASIDDTLAGAQGEQTESRHEKRVKCAAEGTEDFAESRLGVADEWFEEAGPVFAVGAKVARCFVEGLEERGSAAVGEWMGDGDGGVGPLDAEFSQIEFAKKGRGEAHGMDRGADVVMESGEGEFGSAAAAAGSFLCFEDEGAQAIARERDCSGQAVGAGADNDCVVRIGHGFALAGRDDTFWDGKGEA